MGRKKIESHLLFFPPAKHSAEKIQNAKQKKILPFNKKTKTKQKQKQKNITPIYFFFPRLHSYLTKTLITIFSKKISFVTDTSPKKESNLTKLEIRFLSFPPPSACLFSDDQIAMIFFYFLFSHSKNDE